MPRKKKDPELRSHWVTLRKASNLEMMEALLDPATLEFTGRRLSPKSFHVQICKAGKRKRVSRKAQVE